MSDSLYKHPIGWHFCKCQVVINKISCVCGRPFNYKDSQDSVIIHWRGEHYMWECAFNELTSKHQALKKVYEKYKDFDWDNFDWGGCDDGSCEGNKAIEMLYNYHQAIKAVCAEKE